MTAPLAAEVTVRAQVRALNADYPPWRVYVADVPPRIAGVITAPTAGEMRSLLERDRELRSLR